MIWNSLDGIGYALFPELAKPQGFAYQSFSSTNDLFLVVSRYQEPSGVFLGLGIMQYPYSSTAKRRIVTLRDRFLYHPPSGDNLSSIMDFINNQSQIAKRFAIEAKVWLRKNVDGQRVVYRVGVLAETLELRARLLRKVVPGTDPRAFEGMTNQALVLRRLTETTFGQDDELIRKLSGVYA
jgi:hypothetical protein